MIRWIFFGRILKKNKNRAIHYIFLKLSLQIKLFLPTLTSYHHKTSLLHHASS
jgi:hypothetical protein